MIELAAYLAMCAPDIGPVTGRTIVQIESRGYPWTIRDNTANREVKPRPASHEEAVAVAESLIAQGHNLDLGLAGINSSNLPRLGLTVAQVFDPCTNLRAMSNILKRFNALALRKHGDLGATTFYQTLSGYATGSLSRGGKYVSRFIAAANNPSGTNLPVPSRGAPMQPSPILVIADAERSAN